MARDNFGTSSDAPDGLSNGIAEPALEKELVAGVDTKAVATLDGGSLFRSDSRSREIIARDTRDPVVADSLLTRPYEAICRITSRFGRSLLSGSGVLCTPNVVLTCGHLIHDYTQQSGRASSWVIDFGVGPRSPRTIRRNGIRAEVCQTYAQGRDKDLPPYDYGIIVLDVPVTEFHPLKLVEVTSDTVFQSIADDIEVAGYPAPSDTMKTSRGKIVEVVSRGAFLEVQHQVDATPGQSGAPLVAYFTVRGGKAPGVVGVHNKDRPADGQPMNFGAFVGRQMIQEIRGWLS